jgi:photosystem II stability/assembly factor-like uncharacterized protein
MSKQKLVRLRPVAVMTAVLLALGAAAAPTQAAPEKPTPEFIQAGLDRRAEIPLGGDFKPDPKEPAFVAVGAGGRILLSRDDGRTWKQVFFGHPGSDHGTWATSSVAYTDGVFAVSIGWTQPGTWLASEDGERWRHLTAGKTVLAPGKDPSVMPTLMGLAGGKGAFVSAGYTEMAASPDLGQTFTKFNISQSFKNDPLGRKLNTHHVRPIYCGDASGRFLAVGDDRTPENPRFGNLFASDDLGKTWKWLETKLLDEQCRGRRGCETNGRLVVVVDALGANAFVSADAGDTWEGPFPTGIERVMLSVVGEEFWLVGPKAARASADGKTWRDLPAGIPAGKILASPGGTLVNVSPSRNTILRSEDGGRTWTEVHSFTMETQYVHGSQGLRDVAFGLIAPAPAGK